MFKDFIYTLLAVVAVTILPACEGGDNGNKGGNGGNDDANTIVLDRQGAAYYLGKVWDFQGEEHADYYVVLANCEIGQSVQTGFEVPMEVGGWLLFLDLWAEASEDTANAVLPEGEYTFSNQRGMYVLYDQYTIATQNVEKVGSQYRILDRQFKGGSVNVEHTTNGYAIEAVLTTEIDGEDVELTFKYEGPLTFEDQSDDEPWEPGMNEDIHVNPIQATVDSRSNGDGTTSHVIRLFDTSISADGTHPASVGHMIMIDLYTAEGDDFVGTFTPGTMQGNGVMVKEPGVFYPGKFWGGFALGSVVERVYSDMTTESDILTGGTVEIRKAGTNYAFRLDMTTGNGHKLTCEWTGKVDPFVYASTSSLAAKRTAEVEHNGVVTVR